MKSCLAAWFTLVVLAGAAVAAPDRAWSSRCLDQWQRHTIDAQLPYRAMYVQGADIDGDGQSDLVVGAWWYRKPGRVDGKWKRHTIGAPLSNMTTIYDFDGDGDIDILGTQGKGAEPNATFVWGRNDGKGNFTILENVAGGDGDFIQGVAVTRFNQDGPIEIALSWHAANKGVQMLMDSTDMDGDGDGDVIFGEHRGKPKNRVIIYENVDAASSWRSHVIDSGPTNEIEHHDGTITLDTDGDGDLDIASIGWYNPKLWIFENKATGEGARQ